MLGTKFPDWPSFSDDEVAAVGVVLRSNRVNYWTGQECRKFETEYAAWVGTKHAIALSNGTLALDLALQGLGIGAGDEVVVTPRTFLASVSCVVTAGAVPVFAEVDADSGNITAATIAAVLTPRTKAVIVVHIGGWPCDMDPIMALAKAHDFKVIEDCAQAHGARYKGRSVGSIGHVGAWSFCQDKIITTGGEGGMVTTDDPDLWSKMWSYKDHGKSFDAVYSRQHAAGFRWLHESFGTNWRMIEMQAAIGRIQLTKMAEWHALRNKNAQILAAAVVPFVGKNGIVRSPQFKFFDGETNSNDNAHAYYRYYFYVRPDKLADGWSRNRIVEEISKHDVPCFHGTCSEVYLEKAFDDTSWRPQTRLPIAKELGETSVMMLVHPTLTTQNMEQSAQAITSVLSQAGAHQ